MDHTHQPPRFVGEITGHKESVISGGFTADGKFVVTADMNGLIQVFKATKGGEQWVKFGELDEVEEVLFVTVHPTLPFFCLWCYRWIYMGLPNRRIQ